MNIKDSSKRCIIAAAAAGSLLTASSVWCSAQESPPVDVVEDVTGRLRAAVEELEKQVTATRVRIDKERAELAELRKKATAAEAQRDQALEELEELRKAAATASDDEASVGGSEAVDLFAEGIKHWKILEDFPSNGGLSEGKEKGVFRMKMGDPLSGIRYDGPLEMPVTNYEVTLDARRTKGSDFFCAVTFPVNDLKTCCTFVAGGWGGALAGISSLGGMDAANNDTSTFHKFETGQWYTFRIQVTPEFLKVWKDGESIVEVELEGRRVGMRWGDIEYCVPFGLATYVTEAEYRNFKISRIDGKPIPLKKVAEKAPSNDEKAPQ